LYFDVNKLGLVKWYHVYTRIAASTAIGIMLIYLAANNKASNKNIPCNIADILDFAHAFMFTELLTITDVMGSHHRNHDIIFADH
jgi:hypothetical protein